jgi:hypothetical protein
VNPLLIQPLLALGQSIIARMFPDPAEKAKAELELLKLTQEGDLKNILAQLEINAREAQHPSIFVAGWRPFFGWAGGFGFVYAVVGQPLLTWIALNRGLTPPPVLNIDLLWVVVTGLLGIGTLRSVEKVKGTSK